MPRLRLRTPSGRAVERDCARPNRVIPRLVFDAALVDAAVARGAELRRHRVRELAIRPDRVVLDGQIAARVVIGADGANSTVRRLLGAPAAPPAATAVAVRGYAPTSPDPDRMTIEFAPGRYPAYAWSFPLADGRANVGYGVFDRRGSGNRQAVPRRAARPAAGAGAGPGHGARAPPAALDRARGSTRTGGCCWPGTPRRRSTR